MSLLIISDLHIQNPDDPMYAALLNLLRSRAESGDRVVLAGDLFDLFIGNKTIFKKIYSTFFQALSDASNRGVELHYIEGNHDFLIQKAFQSISGMKVHARDVSFEIQGKRFYIAHGDLADRSDYGYRFLRAFFRSPFMKAFVVLMPGRWIQKIGEMSSQTSRKRNPLLPSDLPIRRMESMRRTYRSYAAEQLAKGYDFVVMGHCHDLDEMMFSVGGRPGQYVNVGFPRVHGSYLSWSPGDQKIQREALT